MVDVIRKTFLVGLGAMAITRDRIEQFVSESVQAGEVSSDQAHSLVDELTARADQERVRFEAVIQQQVSRAMALAGLPTKEQMDQLQARVDTLENRVREVAMSVRGSDQSPDDLEMSVDAAEAADED